MHAPFRSKIGIDPSMTLATSTTATALLRRNSFRSKHKPIPNHRSSVSSPSAFFGGEFQEEEVSPTTAMTLSSSSSGRRTVVACGTDFRIPPFPVSAFRQKRQQESAKENEPEDVQPLMDINNCTNQKRLRRAKQRHHVRNTYVLDGSQSELPEITEISLSSNHDTSTRHPQHCRRKNQACSSIQFQEILEDLSSTTSSTASCFEASPPILQ